MVEKEVDTSKPTAVFEAREGRGYTLSIALPGSIIAKSGFLVWLRRTTTDDVLPVHKPLNYKHF